MLNNFFEKRSINFQTIWGSGDYADTQSLAGVAINSESAMTINAVFSAVSLISDTLSTLPMDAFIRTQGARYPLRPRPAWVLKPDVDTTREAFYGSAIVSLLLDAHTFIRISRTEAGQIVNLLVLHLHCVLTRSKSTGRLMS